MTGNILEILEKAGRGIPRKLKHKRKELRPKQAAAELEKSLRGISHCEEAYQELASQTYEFYARLVDNFDFGEYDTFHHVGLDRLLANFPKCLIQRIEHLDDREDIYKEVLQLGTSVAKIIDASWANFGIHNIADLIGTDMPRFLEGITAENSYAYRLFLKRSEQSAQGFLFRPLIDMGIMLREHSRNYSDPKSAFIDSVNFLLDIFHKDNDLFLTHLSEDQIKAMLDMSKQICDYFGKPGDNLIYSQILNISKDAVLGLYDKDKLASHIFCQTAFGAVSRHLGSILGKGSSEAAIKKIKFLLGKGADVLARVNMEGSHSRQDYRAMRRFMEGEAFKYLIAEDESAYKSFMSVLSDQSAPEQNLEMLTYCIHTVYNSEPEEKAAILRNLKLKEKLHQRFDFVDYITEHLLDIEILSLGGEPGTIEAIVENGFFPTKLLVQKYSAADDKEKELELWKAKRQAIAEGRFSPEDEMIVDIEYTHFRTVVNSCTKKPGEFGYREYRRMLDKGPKGYKLKKADRKEIDYLCIEANRLLQYLRQVKEKSEESGRELIVISNYSYGTVALLPIEDILRKEGFRIIPARIGSSECHDNPLYVKEKLLFNGINNEILAKRPNIVVVDGTTHLEKDGSGRYPDSHQGYVNFISIVNDILTDNNETAFADDLFREAEDIKNLRLKKAYAAARACIESHADMAEIKKGEHYKVGFWNPGNMPLSLRRLRTGEKVVESENDFDAGMPRLMIINSTMLSSDMPKDAQKRLGEHKPAYFDDNYTAQAINFKLTPAGVRYSNLLDEEIKKRYMEMFGER